MSTDLTTSVYIEPTIDYDDLDQHINIDMQSVGWANALAHQ